MSEFFLSMIYFQTRILRRQDLDEIMDTITTASGVEVLPCSKWKLFVESIRDPMQRFVGKAIERFYTLKL